MDLLPTETIGLPEIQVQKPMQKQMHSRLPHFNVGSTEGRVVGLVSKLGSEAAASA